MLNTPNVVSKITRAACALLLVCVAIAVALLATTAAQSGRQASDKKNVPAPQPTNLLKRTTVRHDTRRLGFGGSVVLYGAPEGSITVEGWTKGEIEITAEVEQSASTEEDLTRLSAINTLAVVEDLNHIEITTVGTHDRKYLKRVARDLPKNLLTMPWKIDYHLRVPASVDLDIYAGRGALNVNGVEGAIHIKGGEGASTFTFLGGDVDATLIGGPVMLRIPARNWRGHGISVRVASGDLTVELPSGFSGDINAEVLRAGRIENTYAGLAPRERTQPNEHQLQGRAGQGGAFLSFTVGDGTLRITQAGSKQE
jgi:hypothetical protein